MPRPDTTLEEELQKFFVEAELHGNRLTKYVEAEGVKVYLRRCIYWFPTIRSKKEGRLVNAVVIAAVSCVPERQGKFKQLLVLLHKLNPTFHLAVECVHNEHLAAYLTRMGFHQKEQNFYIKNVTLGKSLEKEAILK